jgi:hypothetical protein
MAKKTSNKQNIQTEVSTPIKIQRSITLPAEMAEKIVLHGDIGWMNGEQQTQYVLYLCQTYGLDPLTKPLDIIKFPNARVQVYATKRCSEQLSRKHGISITGLSQQITADTVITTATVLSGNGRTDADIGAVSISGLKGDALTNAIMKSATKAKRRAVLSICGMGMLDESEIETIPGVVKIESIKAKESERTTDEIFEEARSAMASACDIKQLTNIVLKYRSAKFEDKQTEILNNDFLSKKASFSEVKNA